MASRQDPEHDWPEDERSHYDYNNGIPPYEGATWDEDIHAWVSGPDDDEENNDVLPEDIVLEPAPAAAPAAAPVVALAPAPIQGQESRRDIYIRRRRERMEERERREREMMLARAPVVVVPPPPPTPPIEDPRIVEARIGLPSPWEAHISNTYNRVYYFNLNNGTKQWERPTMGGKRTRRRQRRRANKSKRKRSATRRKRTTTTRRRK
jgi:hypothetical protein